MECKRCGFVWIPRIERPRMCPSCKSRLYKEDPTPNKKIVEDIKKVTDSIKDTLDKINKEVKFE